MGPEDHGAVIGGEFVSGAVPVGAIFEVVKAVIFANAKGVRMIVGERGFIGVVELVSATGGDL